MNNQNEKPVRGGNETAKDLMSSLLGTFKDSKSMSKNRRAYLAWVEANGEREVKHTTGVFVREIAGREYPVLTVYVDNRMCMIDFLAQREVYRARLSEQGLEFSDLEFKLDKYNRHAGKGASSSKIQKQGKKIEKRLFQNLLQKKNHKFLSWFLVFLSHLSQRLIKRLKQVLDKKRSL